MMDGGQIWRNEFGDWARLPKPVAGETEVIKVALRVIHYNHRPDDNNPENLRAFCQHCALQHDKEQNEEQVGTSTDPNDDLAPVLVASRTQVNARSEDAAGGGLTLSGSGQRTGSLPDDLPADGGVPDDDEPMVCPHDPVEHLARAARVRSLLGGSIYLALERSTPITAFPVGPEEFSRFETGSILFRQDASGFEETARDKQQPAIDPRPQTEVGRFSFCQLYPGKAWLAGQFGVDVVISVADGKLAQPIDPLCDLLDDGLLDDRSDFEDNMGLSREVCRILGGVPPNGDMLC
jgi:hypothetical protein